MNELMTWYPEKIDYKKGEVTSPIISFRIDQPFIFRLNKKATEFYKVDDSISIFIGIDTDKIIIKIDETNSSPIKLKTEKGGNASGYRIYAFKEEFIKAINLHDYPLSFYITDIEFNKKSKAWIGYKSNLVVA